MDLNFVLLVFVRKNIMLGVTPFHSRDLQRMYVKEGRRIAEEVKVEVS